MSLTGKRNQTCQTRLSINDRMLNFITSIWSIKIKALRGQKSKSWTFNPNLSFMELLFWRDDWRKSLREMIQETKSHIFLVNIKSFFFFFLSGEGLTFFMMFVFFLSLLNQFQAPWKTISSYLKPSSCSVVCFQWKFDQL